MQQWTSGSKSLRVVRACVLTDAGLKLARKTAFALLFALSSSQAVLMPVAAAGSAWPFSKADSRESYLKHQEKAQHKAQKAQKKAEKRWRKRRHAG